MPTTLRALAAVLPAAAVLMYAAAADARTLCSTQVRLVRTYQLHYAPQYQPLLEASRDAGTRQDRGTVVPRLGEVTRYELELEVPRIEPGRGTLAIRARGGEARRQPVSIPSLVPASVAVRVSLPDFGSRIVDTRHARLTELNAVYVRDVSRAASLLAHCLPRQLDDVRERVDEAYAEAISAWRSLAVRMRQLPPGAELRTTEGHALDAEATLEALRDGRLEALNDLVWLSAGIAHARQAARDVEDLKRF